MRIEIETGAYNGRPWIAAVTFDDAGKAGMVFGQWIGSDGERGRLILCAEPGTIVARGQRDYRRPANSDTDYYILDNDGELVPLPSKLVAFNAFRAQQRTEAEYLRDKEN